MADPREEERKRKLATKRPSAFKVADEQAARQRARTPSKPESEKPKPAPYKRRDYRGTRGAIDDAEGLSPNYWK